MVAKQTVYVNEFTDGILDPRKEMAYSVKDGGFIVANTTPGCWGADDYTGIKRRT